MIVIKLRITLTGIGIDSFRYDHTVITVVNYVCKTFIVRLCTSRGWKGWMKSTLGDLNIAGAWFHWFLLNLPYFNTQALEELMIFCHERLLEITTN